MTKYVSNSLWLGVHCNCHNLYLYSELNNETSNHYQFDTYFVTCVIILSIYDSVKDFITFKQITPMTEQSMALDYISLAVTGVGLNPAGDIDYHLAFSLNSRSSQLVEASTNEIYHGVHPE